MLTICNKWFPNAERYPLRNHCKGKEEKWICKRKPIIFSKYRGFLYEMGRFVDKASPNLLQKEGSWQPLFERGPFGIVAFLFRKNISYKPVGLRTEHKKRRKSCRHLIYTFHFAERQAPEPTLSENIIKLQITDNHILSTMQSKSKSF